MSSSDLLISIIIHTSIPLNISFVKLISTQTWPSMCAEKKQPLLGLLISSLKCLKEWRECLSELACTQADTPDDLLSTDEARKLVVETVKHILTDSNDRMDTFHVRFTLGIAPRYLPSKDALSSAIKEASNDEATLLSEALTLYSDVFDIADFDLNTDQSKPCNFNWQFYFTLN